MIGMACGRLHVLHIPGFQKLQSNTACSQKGSTFILALISTKIRPGLNYIVFDHYGVLVEYGSVFPAPSGQTSLNFSTPEKGCLGKSEKEGKASSQECSLFHFGDFGRWSWDPFLLGMAYSMFWVGSKASSRTSQVLARDGSSVALMPHWWLQLWSSQWTRWVLEKTVDSDDMWWKVPSGVPIQGMPLPSPSRQNWGQGDCKNILLPLEVGAVHLQALCFSDCVFTTSTADLQPWGDLCGWLWAPSCRSTWRRRSGTRSTSSTSTRWTSSLGQGDRALECKTSSFPSCGWTSFVSQLGSASQRCESWIMEGEAGSGLCLSSLHISQTRWVF